MRVPGGEAVQRVYAVERRRRRRRRRGRERVAGRDRGRVRRATAATSRCGARALPRPARRAIGSPTARSSFPVPHRQRVVRVALAATTPARRARRSPDCRRRRARVGARARPGDADRAAASRWQSEVDAARVPTCCSRRPSARRVRRARGLGLRRRGGRDVARGSAFARAPIGAAPCAAPAPAPVCSATMRAALVREHGATSTCFPGSGRSGSGSSLAVHDVPLRDGPLLVRGALARRASGAAVGRARRARALRAPALDPGVVVDRRRGRDAARRAAGTRCCRWDTSTRVDGAPIDDAGVVRVSE